MAEQSLAMIFDGPGKPLRPQTFALPELADGQLLVEVTCSTLCGSDLHTYEGRRSTPCPTILGHEILGRIAALPPGKPFADAAGAPLKIGDRVTWSVAASCGGCFYCRDEIPQKCERLFKYGHEAIDDVHPLSGGLAEHCHLARGTPVLRVPDELPDAIACPANCATATVAAALRVGGDIRDRTVLVQGAGMLGLTASAMARWQGAREVIVCDIDAARLDWAIQFGATRSVHLADDAPGLKDVVDEVTEGRGVDLALELSGAPAAVEQGYALLRIGGRYVLVGAVFPTRDVALSPERIVRRLLRIEGIHNYAPRDLQTALEFLLATHRQHPFEKLVTASYRLADADAAFGFALQTKAPRVAIVPAK